MDKRTVDWISEVIRNMFWMPVGRNCRHIVTAAGLHVERDYCGRLRLYWYNGQN